MKITNIAQVEDFIKAVDKCDGEVWLESPYGDKLNLKSRFSQYIALGQLLGEHGEYLDLYCSEPNDKAYFFKYFADYPEVNNRTN